MSCSRSKSESVCCEHCFKSNNYWPTDLNNENTPILCLHTCCDILWQPKSNCKLIRFTLHGWTKLSVINESAAQVRSRHDHHRARKCIGTWWPVGIELASCFFLKIMCLQMSLCFMNHNLWPYFILWEPKKKRLLGTAVFIAHVLTAEITTCITSLLSTCRHLAGKQPDECKGCNSVFVLAKKLQPIYLTKYRIFGITSIRPHFKCI